jgi:hypothetical protein
VIEVWLGGMLLASVVGLARRHLGSRPRIAMWRAAASAVGLEEVTVRLRFGRPPRLEARRGHQAVELRARTTDDRQVGTGIQVSGVVQHLTVGVARAPVVSRFIGPHDIVVGDDAFDAAMDVHGEPSSVLAILDAETRCRLLALFDVVPRADERMETSRKGAEVTAGHVSVICLDGPGFGRVERLTRSAREIVGLAERLQAPASVEDALGANAVGDPVAGVRLRCLDALLARRPDHPATRAVVGRAQDDVDESVALRAALELGGDGHATLRRLALAPETTEAAFLRAVEALAASWTGTDAEHVLGLSPQAGRERVVASCLTTLAAAGGTHVTAVARVLAGARGERAVAAARALGGCPSAEPEAALVSALAHADAPVRAAAAESLGRVGTVAAVVALRDAESTGDRALRRTARAAVAAIQSRLVGADRGQLTVASDSGELSLAESPDGRVSIPRDGDLP